MNRNIEKIKTKTIIIWILCSCCNRLATWVSSSIHSPVPEGAISAGRDQDGSPIYIGRAWHEGDQIPAKVIPSKQACYIAHGGHEIPKNSFEVLCHGNISWIPTNPMTRSVPPFALSAGKTSSGEPLYIGKIKMNKKKNSLFWIWNILINIQIFSGRAHHNGSLTVGKLQISHGALYIPFGGAEVPIHSEIEVLVEN